MPKLLPWGHQMDGNWYWTAHEQRHLKRLPYRRAKSLHLLDGPFTSLDDVWQGIQRLTVTAAVEDIGALPKLTRLETLDLWPRGVSHAQLDLSRSSRLQTLAVGSGNIDLSSLRRSIETLLLTEWPDSIDLTSLPNLRRLNLSVIRDKEMRLPGRLQDLAISFTRWAERGPLDATVENLSLTGISDVGDVAEVVSNIPGVRRLHLENCKRVASAAGLSPEASVTAVNCPYWRVLPHP